MPRKPQTIIDEQFAQEFMRTLDRRLEDEDSGTIRGVYVRGIACCRELTYAERKHIITAYRHAGWADVIINRMSLEGEPVEHTVLLLRDRAD